MSALAPLVSVLTVAAVAVAACDEATEPPRVSERIGPGDTYVALGDSYTAAPGIGPIEDDDGCFRSRNNYPHLLAEELGLDLVDRSCIAATTEAIADPQQTPIGVWADPQLADVDRGTELVTLRIGGNDFGLYRLLTQVCLQAATTDPDGAPCTDTVEAADGPSVAARLERLADRVTRVVRAVVRRAPDAEVLVVGYPSFVPEDAPCDELPLAAGDLPLALRINRGLNTAMETAADRVGVPYVDVYAATEGHDICSDDPWVAGGTASRGRAAPWHPYAEEQQATAEAVLAVLEDS